MFMIRSQSCNLLSTKKNLVLDSMKSFAGFKKVKEEGGKTSLFSSPDNIFYI